MSELSKSVFIIDRCLQERPALASAYHGDSKTRAEVHKMLGWLETVEASMFRAGFPVDAAERVLHDCVESVLSRWDASEVWKRTNARAQQYRLLADGHDQLIDALKDVPKE